jgi:acyl-CoA hydrolase
LQKVLRLDNFAENETSPMQNAPGLKKFSNKGKTNMSDKNTTETPENVNFADENATTAIKITISEIDATDILTSLGVPVPNELPNEIRLNIQNKN